MAIYYCHAQIISRSDMRSSVAAAAYRAGERIKDERENKTHDYSKRKDVAYNHVFTPSSAPNWAADRKELWNEVERKEKAVNAQLAREFVIALPLELKPEDQITLAKDFAQYLANEGMCADLSVHMKEGNPHAHILCTVRAFNNEKWAAKSKKVYILDSNGNKQYDKRTKTYKCRKENYTNWNSKEFLLSVRETYEKNVNRALEQANVNVRISCKSLEQQGIDRLPTIHEGYAAREIEKRGGKSDRCEINRQIQHVNRAKNAQNHAVTAKLESEIKDMKKEIKTLTEAYIELERFVEPVTIDDYRANALAAKAAYERHKKIPRPGILGIFTGKRNAYDRETKILKHDAKEYIERYNEEIQFKKEFQEELLHEKVVATKNVVEEENHQKMEEVKELKKVPVKKRRKVVGLRRKRENDRGRGRNR